MVRVRHARGALAFVLYAGILRCFVAPRTQTRPVPRCPVRAGAGETNHTGSYFSGAVQKAAGNNKTDVEAYITEIKTRAGQHMNSSL